MKVESVNSVGFRSNNYSFGEKQRVNEGVSVSQPIKSQDLAKVPVIVLLAMNPATLNSAIPARTEIENSNNMEMLTSRTKAAEESTYVIAPEVEQAKQLKPYKGWGLKGYKVIDVIPDCKAKPANFDMMYCNDRFEDSVSDVFFIFDDQPAAASPYTPPPRVREIVFHNTDDGDKYYGVKVMEPLLDENRKPEKYMLWEIRIDDSTAKKLLDLLNGKTKYRNSTLLRVTETTSPRRMRPEMYE